MLAGLLFANEDGVAELRYAGSTVVEHQAASLAGAGVSHVLILCRRPTAALRAAAARMTRGGTTVDIVADAQAAAAALHPLAAVLMLAEGLVEAGAALSLVSMREGEALVAVPAADAPATWERIGGGRAWAGAARLDPRRLHELTMMPGDYDPCSTLLRLAAAAGARCLAADQAPPPVLIRDAADLAVAEAGRLAAATAPRPDWFDRRLLDPAAAALAIACSRRGVGVVPIVAVAAGIAAAAMLFVAGGGFGGAGVFALAALLAAATARMAAAITEHGQARGAIDRGVALAAAAAAAFVGWRHDQLHASGDGLPVALALIAAAALAERSGAAPPHWWGVGACTAMAATVCIVAPPLAGLVLAALYAGGALTFAVERLRRLARP